MKFLMNGIEGNRLIHIRKSDSVFNVLFLADNGTPLNISSPATAEVEFFSSSVRTDAPITTISVTPAAGAAAGYGTLLIQDNNLDLPRGELYAWGRYTSNGGTGSGTLVSIGTTSTVIKVI